MNHLKMKPFVQPKPDCLIDLDAPEEQQSVYSVLMKHFNSPKTIKISTNNFVGKPITFICDLHKLSMDLNTMPWQYSPNRKPNETDADRTKKIFQLQWEQHDDIHGDDGSVSYIYDNADWKLTFSTVNGSDCRLIDGGHRLIASRDLPDILSTIQIFDFDSEDSRLEKYKIINSNTDLPAFFKLSNTDQKRITIDNIIDHLKVLNYFNKPNNHLKCCAPYLDEMAFKSMLMNHSDNIIGRDVDDTTSDKVVANFVNLNRMCLDKLQASSFAMYRGLFYRLMSNKTCHSLTKSSVRCTFNAKSGLFCGHHNKDSIDSFPTPSFDTIKRESLTLGICLGLYIDTNSISDIPTLDGLASEYINYVSSIDLLH